MVSISCSPGAPQSRSCLEVCPESVNVPVMLANMFESAQLSPSYSRSLASCQLMSAYVSMSWYFWQNPWTTLPAFLAAASDWLLPVGWLRCNRPLLLPEVGSKPGSVREEPRPELVPCDPGSRTWQHLTAWVCVWKCRVPHCTQWFCWSLSQSKMAISLGIYPTFSDKPMEAVDTFRIYKLQLATQSTRWGHLRALDQR